MAYDAKSFQQLLMMAVKNDVSDVHLRTGEKPYFRMRGNLKPIKGEAITMQDMANICNLMIKDKSVITNIKTVKEHDGSYQLGKICRVRYNLLRFQGQLALILRIIILEVPTIEQLGLPAPCGQFAKVHRGLVLVTGVTGSGKSSTLAAIVEQINLTREEHVLTIEDPVEFLYSSKKCRITQREVGSDTENFEVALRGALRQDPDVIVIGEMRDAETIQIAIKAAETGHLVFGTVHTTNALTTVNRLISMFPPEEQQNVAARLADNLHGTISQRLLKTMDGKGRVCAQEIMINTTGVQDAIRGKEPLSSMYISITSGKRSGSSQSFDQHLADLYLGKIISKEEALQNASSPTNFERDLEFGANSDDANSAKKEDAEGGEEGDDASGTLTLDIA